MNCISEIQPCLDVTTAKAIVHLLIISLLDKCNGLYVGLTNSDLRDLQMVINRAAHLVVRQRIDPNISIVST